MTSSTTLRERVKRHMADRGVMAKDRKELRQLAEKALKDLADIPIDRPVVERRLRVLEGRVDVDG